MIRNASVPLSAVKVVTDSDCSRVEAIVNIAGLSSTMRTFFVIVFFQIRWDSLSRTNRLVGKLQRHVQHIRKLFNLDRFSQIPEKPRLQTLLNIPRDRVGAERYDGDVRRRGIITQDLQSF